jgi:hypothetical protein
MSVQRAPTHYLPPRQDPRQHSSTVDTRLQGRWLLLARVVWLVVVLLTLTIFFASLPEYVAQLQTPCAGSVCAYLQLSAEQVKVLQGVGFSPGDYAAYTIALTLAIMALCLVVSTLIVWRRPDDRMALLVALMLVTFGPIFVTSSVLTSSPLQIPNACLYFLALSLLVLVFLLFPSGQFVPRWTRWTLVVSLAVQVPVTFFPNAPFTLTILGDSLGYFMLLGEIMILVGVQLYRYRRVSSPLERQQTKWVVFGMALPITVYIGGTVLSLIFPALADYNSLYGAPYQLALNAISTCLILLIPLSFGFAMLRSRLWDIDVLINRTLVYGALTVSLTAVYVGLVIGLSALLRGLISQDNSVAIVLSTLAIAALAQRLKQGIQRSIDRRFYRRKYDAAKTLAAFSSTLRQEVDLDQLREQLLAVAQETMQPAHVSLWLRKPEQAGKYKAIDAYTTILTGDNHEHEHLSGDDEPGIGPRLAGREQRVVR